MTTSIPLQLKELVANPSAHFDGPHDILEHLGLSDEQKKMVLDAWEEDARRLSIATEEGMTGGEPSRVAEVLEAKAELGLEDKRPSSPTKAG
jgi:hypothetical protein